MSSPILLVGAMCVGKSTVGRLLAPRLGVPYRSTDAMWNERATALGLNSRHAAALWAQGQYDALYAYGKPFEVALLEWLPLEPGVVEVGATFTVQSDPVLAERCRAALRRHPNVVHLVASQDPAENERVLWARFLERRDGKAPEEPEQSLWRQSLNQSIAAQAATHTVYTGDRAPEDIAEVIHRAVVTPYGVASRVI